ncbi:GAF domain-containing sensor histidine kinase [Palleronia abyssalis]|uniref:histidine kinase n=1 Tax=Palleronia abyssalis TaxID=1501240 RepID=A0A2R8BZ97_9RHOB|nr:GAF domain-containing sensor histidine kinase [Palleronia abyssalis]SPJ25495.1 Bacteriophytochrome [Palleronia abyssalis]
MQNEGLRRGLIQDHAAFQARAHDFQADIEMLANSDLVRTILETVMLATDTRFAAVARVTADRWVACRTVDEIDFGLLEGDEIEIESTFCQSVRETSRKVLFDDVATDDIYRNHPIATKFGIVSYASIPIRRSDGSFFGTLCAIDTEPRGLKHPRVVAMLEMFADVIGRGLETEERLEAQEQLVAHERDLARTQEQFIAVLGHDLRNPVAALEAGLRQLARQPLNDRAQKMLPLMRSSVHRMHELIDNMMLHAKARLGGGIRVNAAPDAPLAVAITQVVGEIRAASPGHEIRLDLSFDRPINCDAARVAQAVSNLISNAVRHGTPGAPIGVQGATGDREVAISVTNRGEAIADDLRRRLFQPFWRGTQEGEGLGLGLHIASSIAVAHGGRIEVTCGDGTTSFTFKLPVLPEKN